jgi:hypothetical protein
MRHLTFQAGLRSDLGGWNLHVQIEPKTPCRPGIKVLNVGNSPADGVDRGSPVAIIA